MKGKWPEQLRQWREVLGTYRYIFVVIVAGILLLLLPGGNGTRETAQSLTEKQEETFDLEAFEEKLARTLSQIEGAGSVDVMLMLDGSSRKILARDQEQDGKGGISSSAVTVGQGGGTQDVVPLQTMAPRFRGALVVCPGGGEANVRLRLMEAVSAVTGLGSDRISICQGKGK